jgi:hypothetical protein
MMMAFQLPEHMKDETCRKCGGKIDVMLYSIASFPPSGDVLIICKKCIREILGINEEK